MWLKLLLCHLYTTSYFIFNDFYTCFTHFSLTVSISTNRGLPSLALRMVFLPSTDGCTWISTRISLARTLYIHSCARSISENTHARNRTRETRKWRHILRKLLDLTKSPSERYKLIKGSCTTCIQAALLACSWPNFELGRLKKKKKKKKKKKWKKKMEKIAVFPFSVYNSSDVF